MGPHPKPNASPLRRARFARRWTLADEGQYSGLSVAYIHALETGAKRGTPHAWAKLAEALRVPVGQIRPHPARSADDGRQLEIEATQ
jgi:transcriptional regulator with XRE-family HTH domain